MAKTAVCTFWEGPISWLERLCLASIVDAGHALTVFTFEPKLLSESALPGDIHDVRDLLPLATIADRFRERKLYSYFADIVRLAILRAGRGMWSDADCLFKSEVGTADYVMGYVGNDRINNAILLTPPECPALQEYFNALTGPIFRTPWATPHRRIRRDIAILFGFKHPREVGKHSIGPRALTYFVNKHGLTKQVSNEHRFYPVPTKDARSLIHPDDRAVRTMVERPGVEVVHAWRQALRFDLQGKPPASSYLGQQCRKYDI